MVLNKFIFSLIILFGFQSFSQTDEVIFSIDNEPISVSEFTRVFNKNLNIVNDENQKDVENYLDLYVNYKLKVRQAQDLGLDTVASYRKELLSYKKQIMAPYLRDDEFIDKLVKEAYDRSLIEINASHILIKVDKSSTDTIAAYAKIKDIKTKIDSGEKFGDMAMAYSDDGSAKTNKGNLGYFSVFDMVYPFENAIYGTEVGQTSTIFRTRFGYHLTYVHDVRDARGEVTAAHIMLKHDSISGKAKIDKLYSQLQNGEDFASLAKQYSDDKYTGEKGGDLGRFGSGKMVKEFEETVFSLKNIEDYSKPFKTQYGWHIVKLTDKFPVESFDKQKESLISKVKRGDRASIVSNSIIYKIKDDYNIIVNEESLNLVKSGSIDLAKDIEKELMTLEGERITIKSLMAFLSGRAFNNSLFEKFKNDQIMEYYKLHLEETNQEFAYTYLEYKEGLLLFELMQDRIWERSSDSIGIKAYFETHKKDYKKEQSFEVESISSLDKSSIERASSLLKNNKNIDEIKKILDSDDSLLYLKETIAISNNSEDKFKEEVGVSKIYEEDNRFVIYNTLAINAEADGVLEEVRGKVLNDYQEFLESEWIKELHQQYTVEINKEILKNLSNSLNEN